MADRTQSWSVKIKSGADRAAKQIRGLLNKMEKQMADKDTKDPVIEEKVVETPPVETPPAEDKPVEIVEEVEDPEEVEEVEEVEEAPPSRREQLRIQQVLARVKESQQQTPAPSISPDALNYSELDATPEMIKQLEDDRAAAVKAASAEANGQLQTYRWETLLNIDAPTIEQKYPQLDKNDSEKFHPALANAINTMYLSAAGYNPDNGSVTNPNIRYKDYVDSVFELANEIAGEKIEVSTKNIKKQAAQTGIRPGGGTAKRMNLNQTPNQMSDEELSAKIEQDFKALGLA